MSWVKLSIFLLVLTLLTSCAKSKHELNPFILGEWKLIEIYGVMAENPTGWMTVPTSPVQTMKFSSNGEYSLSTDGTTTCTGYFVFEGNNNIKLNPYGCLPLVESLETIYTLTHDTLTISNKSNSLASYNLTRDKFIRIR
jgi:hypothetical protein